MLLVNGFKHIGGGASTPAYVQSWTKRDAVVSTTDITISPTDDNYLILDVQLNDGPNGVDTPTGWTLIHEDYDNEFTQSMFGKVASSDTSVTVDIDTSFSGNVLVTVHEFSGVNTTTPYEAKNNQAVGLTTGITIPAMTSTGTNRLALATTHRLFDKTAPSTDASNYTMEHSWTFTSAGESIIRLYTLEVLTASTTSTDAITYANNKWSGAISVMLIPE